MTTSGQVDKSAKLIVFKKKKNKKNKKTKKKVKQKVKQKKGVGR